MSENIANIPLQPTIELWKQPSLNFLSYEVIWEIRENLHLGKITCYTVETVSGVICKFYVMF